jgi:hypothetical protein
VTLALKEWHVVCEAIARGDQVLTLRKGGIREKAFAVAGASFWLYPTWQHQQAADVKRAWRGELARSNAERRADGSAPIRCACRVEAAWEVTDASTLNALDHHHLWAATYIQSRLAWRPTKPLTVLLLRASALVEPVMLAADERFAGCRSWLELGIDLPAVSLIESLTDDAFALHAAPIRETLGTPTPITVP